MPREMATLNVMEILLPLQSFSTKLVLARHTNVHYTYTATHIPVDMMRLYHAYVSPHYGTPTARFQSWRRCVPCTEVCFPTVHNPGRVHTVLTPANSNSKRQVLHTPKDAEGHCLFSHQHHAICTRYNILQVLGHRRLFQCRTEDRVPARMRQALAAVTPTSPASLRWLKCTS